MSGQLHAPAALLPGKISGTHWIGSWVGPSAGLEREAERKKFSFLDPPEK